MDVQGPALWEALGSAIGRMDARLAGFDHPGLHREHAWDLRCPAPAESAVAPTLLVDEGQRRVLDPRPWYHVH